MRSAWLLALAGCYGPTVTPGAPCGPDDACPRELVCRGGRCERPGPDGDGGVADGVTDSPLDAPADTPGDAGGCPPGYAALAGTPGCYRVVPTQRTWLEAQEECVASGGHLAIPDDDAERVALFAAGGMTTWLGIHDQDEEGTFVTVLGAPATYLVWALAEPNNGGGLMMTGQDCVQFFETDELDDDFCTRLKNYICEVPP